MQRMYANIFLNLLMFLLQAPKADIFKSPSIAERLNAYPKSRALSYHLNSHLDAEWQLKQNHLLSATYYSRNKVSLHSCTTIAN